VTLEWTAQLAWISAGAGAVMLALWAIQWKTRDAGVVDVGWAACLGLSAAFCAVTGPGDAERRLILGAMGAVWGLRLASHLLFDRVLKGPEDGRYQMMREKLGSRVQPVMLAFFEAQALLVVVLSAPFVLGSLDTRPGPGWLDWTGLAIWIIGIAGESVADGQLKAFKKRATSKGQVCDVGLWRYSRHPNYFFEWLIWIGYATIATAAPMGWLAWSAPALILFFVLKVTGIPPTEARALKSRPEAYRRYQQTTSAFFPWFPRAAAAGPSSDSAGNPS
jgi:steroid 5-alpha reductase family enzyme